MLDIRSRRAVVPRFGRLFNSKHSKSSRNKQTEECWRVARGRGGNSEITWQKGTDCRRKSLKRNWGCICNFHEKANESPRLSGEAPRGPRAHVFGEDNAFEVLCFG